MRLQQIQKSYLYEGLDSSTSSSMMLWESAGCRLKEAALTADQIQSLFKEIEAGITAGGTNRTLLGKGKDAASAVNKAWEDLKSKMQDSGPIKDFDKKVSDVLSKIGMGAAEPEFDGKVNEWVQKYRDFAKKHPIAQGAIYATLIALAGISGAGIGGAAALGLLKLSDQLLQGKRFTSAAYSGAKAGALAFGASKLGDYIKGLMKGDQIPAPGGAAGELPPGVPKMDFDKYDYYLGDSNNIVSVPKGSPNPFTGGTGGAGGIGNIDGADLVPSDASNTGRFMVAGEPVIPGQPLTSQQMMAVDMSKDMGNTPSPQVQAAYDLTKQSGDGVQAAQSSSNFATSSDMPRGAAFSPDYLQGVVDGEITRPKISPEQAQAAMDWQAQNGGQSKVNMGATDTVSAADAEKPNPLANRTRMPASDVQTTTAPDGTTTTTGTLKGVTADQIQNHPAYKAEIERFGDNPESRRAASMKARSALLKGESRFPAGRKLSEGQIYMIFNRVVTCNDRLLTEGELLEGPFDAVKRVAGRGMDYVKTKGKNLTNKVTADKLNSAWKAAGSPMDSEAVAKVLADAGVNADVTKKVYADLKIDAGAAPDAAVDIETVKQMLAKLPTDGKVKLLKYLTKQPAAATA